MLKIFQEKVDNFIISSGGKNWFHGLDLEYDKIKKELQDKKLTYIEIDFKNFSFSEEEIENLDIIFKIQKGKDFLLSHEICKSFDLSYEIIENYGLATYLTLGEMEKGKPIINGAGKIYELFYRVFSEAEDGCYILCKNLTDGIHMLIRREIMYTIKKIVNVNFVATLSDPNDIILKMGGNIIDVDKNHY